MVSPAWQNTALGYFTAAQIPGGGQGSIPGEELVPAAPAREPAVDKAGAASSAVAAAVKKWSDSGQTAVKQRSNSGQTEIQTDN